MNLFYTPDITTPLYTLSEEESRHCLTVLRMKSGDKITLTDGKGNLYNATITGEHPKKCTIEITETLLEYGKKPYTLHVAIAPTKNIERFEWFLEKATEIGIHTITPIICEHSERKNINQERLHKILASAMKQSLATYLPELRPLQYFNKFIAQPFNSSQYIAHCEDREKFNLKDIYKKGDDTLILIGPEGDFSEKEIKFAIQNGYKEITLGSSRLRTETAGIICCSIIQFLNQ